MMGRQQCETVLEKALALSEAEQTDVYLQVGDHGLTRFAGNGVHQNVAHRDAQLHVRAVTGSRLGRATTNDLSDRGIAKTVAQAHQNALLLPEDLGFHGLPQPSAPREINSYDQATAGCGPGDRAEVVGAVCRKARAQGLNASGAYRTGAHESAVMSTRGARAYHAATSAGLIITVMTDTSSGWAKGGSWRVTDIDAESLGNEAVERALRGRDPRAVPPGRYAVVLDHYAVDDILGALSLYGMGAQAVQDGRSWMNGVMGQPAMSSQVTIWDDGADPQGWPMPFDTEGVPRQRVEVVKEGVVGSPVHSSYTAGKEGRASTGHQANFTGGPLATNLFLKEGGAKLEDMIASTQRGLYVTRFHYTRLVHSRGCMMTGMTRDGVFLVEDGRVTCPVKNLRFTQSYVEALAGVEAVGNRSRLVLNETGFATKVPPLKLSSFNFTGNTV